MNDPNSVTIITHCDMDGYCSGAIARKYFVEKYRSANTFVEVKITNHNRPFDFTQVSTDTVVVLDFSFKPDDMMRLKQICQHLIWIDHHATAITDMDRLNFNPAGVRDTTKAACELAWEYFFPTRPTPMIVKLIGDADINSGMFLPDSAHLSYALYGLMDLRPYHNAMPTWNMLFENEDIVKTKITDGKAISESADLYHSLIIKECSFETELLGYKVLACNTRGNGKLYDNLSNKGEYYALVTFIWQENIKQWRFSIYSPNQINDVSLIAKEFGGGGHPFAAGFCVSALTDNFLQSRPEAKDEPCLYDEYVSKLKTCQAASTACLANRHIAMISQSFIKEMFGYKFMCINASHIGIAYGANSSSKENADALLTYVYTATGKWRIDIYPFNSNVDLAKIYPDEQKILSTNNPVVISAAGVPSVIATLFVDRFEI